MKHKYTQKLPAYIQRERTCTRLVPPSLHVIGTHLLYCQLTQLLATRVHVTVVAVNVDVHATAAFLDGTVAGTIADTAENDGFILPSTIAMLQVGINLLR